MSLPGSSGKVGYLNTGCFFSLMHQAFKKKFKKKLWGRAGGDGLVCRMLA